MTCREFMDIAESLTPSQLLLMQSENEYISTHVRDCSACGTWMASQRLLGGALQALQARTAQREASPKVEQAVLQAFRMQGFGPIDAVAPERAAPAAWKLSRFFEIGAYAAVAAALIVGVFLGTRMWQDKHAPSTQAQAQSVSTPQQGNSESGTSIGMTAPSDTKPTVLSQNSAHSGQVNSDTFASKRTEIKADQVSASNIDKQGFVALMLCDPLICSGDEQIIRMELPANGADSADGTSAQPVIADVVVGDDGLVRAMRIVN